MTHIAVFTLLCLLPAAAHAQVPQWKLVADGAVVEFTATYGQDPITGNFTATDADIHLDPQQPETGSIRVTVPMASLTTQDEDAAEYLPQDVWLDSAAYPQAVFVSENIRTDGKGGYLAEGSLTLKGITAPLSLAFTLKLSEDSTQAEAEGSAELSRLAYKVGEGEWESTDQLKDAVTLRFRLQAIKQH